MKTFIRMVAMAAGLVALTHAASAMPGLAEAPAEGFGMFEQARILCEPSGRCFRIDPYGRRIFVPRPFGYGYGRPGFEGPDMGRPGFGFGVDPDRRDPEDEFGRRRRPRDQNDMRGDRDAAEMRGDQGANQQRRPSPGRERDGNNQRRERPPQQEEGR